MVQVVVLRRSACSKRFLRRLEKFMDDCTRSTASKIERLVLRRRYRFILGELDARSGDPCQTFFPCWMNQTQRDHRTSSHQWCYNACFSTISDTRTGADKHGLLKRPDVRDRHSWVLDAKLKCRYNRISRPAHFRPNILVVELWSFDAARFPAWQK